MGGAARLIRRVFSSPSPTPPPQVMSAGTLSKVTKVDRRPGQGSGVAGTIMTDATGLEEEANVQKTVLGGTKKKRKYTV